MTSAPEFDFTTFPNDGGYDEMVLVENIPVRSLCEHHMLPFLGVAHVGYLPGSGSWACRSSPGWSSSTPAGLRRRSA